jgi:hypothetical protein
VWALTTRMNGTRSNGGPRSRRENAPRAPIEVPALLMIKRVLDRTLYRPRGRAVSLWMAATDSWAAMRAHPQGSPRHTLERALRFGDFSVSEIPRAELAAERMTLDIRHSEVIYE